MELETALLKMWLSSGKSAEDVHRLFRFDLVADFTHNPLLHSWVSYVDMILKENPGKASAILSSLESHIREKPLNQILLEAMRFLSMEKAANAIQSQKIKSYLANNESPEHVFQWLNLDHVGDNLLIDPLFAKWLKYAKDFSKKNPKHQELFYSTIYRKYNSALIERMIEVAMKNPSTVNVVKLIEKERAKLWLQKNELPLRIFRELGLDWAREKTLASPNFKIWVKYLNAFNRRYPDEKTTMIDGLRAYYNDLNLVDMLHAAKQDTSTTKLATNLESALVNKWVAKKEPLDDLKRRFSHMRIADDVIERYAAKVNALAGKTS